MEPSAVKKCQGDGRGSTCLDMNCIDCFSKTVPPNVAYCRGSVCHSFADCDIAGECKYQSSGESFKEIRTLRTVVDEAPAPSVDVKNFTGTIDGGGFKGSMIDPNKPPLSLIDPTFLWGLGQVLGFGAKKYAPGNWLRGMKWSEVLSGIQRHLAAIAQGEDTDSDSGLPHVYHLSCGVMFLSRFMTDPKYKEFDDRLFKAAL